MFRLVNNKGQTPCVWYLVFAIYVSVEYHRVAIFIPPCAGRAKSALPSGINLNVNIVINDVVYSFATLSSPLFVYI